MTLDTFERGEDIYREIPLQADGVVVDTADFDTIEVRVLHKHSKVNIGTYSVALGTVTRELPTADGIISFIIPVADNEDAQTGIYQCKVTTTETDIDYPDNIRTRIGKEDNFILRV